MPVKFSLALSVLWLALAGCGSDEQAAQRNQAADDFAIAHAHLENAAAGFVADAKFDASHDALVRYLKTQDVPAASTSVGMFQVRELEAAQQKLTPLLSAGTPAQQAAAARDLAQTHAMRARMHTQNAVSTWANESALSKENINTLAAARQAHTLAQAHRKIDSAQELRKANARLSQAREDMSRQDQQIEQLNAELSRLTQQRDAALARQKEKAQTAADHLKRSLEAAGQARFDLAEKSAALSRQADKAAAEAESLNSDIDVLKAKIRIAQIEKAQTQTMIDSNRQTINKFNERRRRLGQTAREADQAAAEYGEKLRAGLAERAAEHERRVVNQFDQAREHMEQATETLEQVEARAQGQVRESLLAARAAKQAELGFMLRQGAQIDRGYARTMQLMADQAEAGFPQQQGDAIRQMAQAAQQRVEESQAAATAALTAGEQVLLEAEGVVADREASIAINRQLLAVYRSLDGLTGGDNFSGKAATVEAKLRELRGE